MFPKEVATEASRKSCFRTPFRDQRVNGFQTALKVARHHYYPFFPWIPGKLSWKRTALPWSYILILFANTLTADDMYSCRNMQNLMQNFKRYYLKNGRLFPDFLLHFRNVYEIKNIFNKNMSVIASLIPKLLFPKEVAIETSKRSCFRTPFGNQPVHEFQTALKDARHH